MDGIHFFKTSHLNMSTEPTSASASASASAPALPSLEADPETVAKDTEKESKKKGTATRGRKTQVNTTSVDGLLYQTDEGETVMPLPGGEEVKFEQLRKKNADGSTLLLAQLAPVVRDLVTVQRVLNDDQADKLYKGLLDLNILQRHKIHAGQMLRPAHYSQAEFSLDSGTHDYKGCVAAPLPSMPADVKLLLEVVHEKLRGTAPAANAVYLNGFSTSLAVDANSKHSMDYSTPTSEDGAYLYPSSQTSILCLGQTRYYCIALKKPKEKKSDKSDEKKTRFQKKKLVKIAVPKGYGLVFSPSVWQYITLEVSDGLEQVSNTTPLHINAVFRNVVEYKRPPSKKKESGQKRKAAGEAGSAKKGKKAKAESQPAKKKKKEAGEDDDESKKKMDSDDEVDAAGAGEDD